MPTTTPAGWCPTPAMMPPVNAAAIAPAVLLHGPAAAGKSRAAAKAIREIRGAYRLLIPQDIGSLRALADSGFDFHDVVIWLDDIERHLGPNGMDVGLVHRLCPAGRHEVTIVATIRDEVSSPLMNKTTAAQVDGITVDIERTGVELIRQITDRRRIPVSAELSPY
jgi:hypothetical protein